jgi:hypothetical protein
MDTNDKDARTLAIITHEVGLLEMADGRTTPDDRRWAQDVVASMRTRIAEYRRSKLPEVVTIRKAVPITERLRDMARTTLEALFGSLVERCGPDLQFGHRKLEMLSDNDLRRLIQLIETHTKQG